MHVLILSLNLVNVLALAAVGVLGFVVGEGWHSTDPEARRQLMLWHTGAGFFTALYALFVHGFLIFTYFIGTGLAVKEAVREHRLDPELIRPTRKFKAQAFPLAFFAVLFVVAGTVVGGGVAVRVVVDGVAHPSIPTWLHVALIGLGFAASVAAIPFEVRACRENVELIRRIEALIDAKSTPARVEK